MVGHGPRACAVSGARVYTSGLRARAGTSGDSGGLMCFQTAENHSTSWRAPKPFRARCVRCGLLHAVCAEVTATKLRK